MLRALLTPVLGGILLGCCFLPGPAHWLAWIGLVPIAFAIAARRRVAAVYVGTYGAGLLFNLISTDWIRTLEGGSGLSGQTAPDWLVQSQLLALFWPLSLFLGRLLVRFWPMPMSLALPAVWVIHELLLRNLWTLVDATGWHIYMLGYAIIDYRYLSQIGDLGGISAVSLLVASINGALWDLLTLWQSRKQNIALQRGTVVGVGMALLLLVFSYAYGAWAVAHTVVADGPNIWLMPDELLREPPAEMPWQAKGAAAPDILLWSELAYGGPPVDAARAARAARGAHHSQVAHDTPAEPLPPDRTLEQRQGESEKVLQGLCRRFAVPLVAGYTRAEHVAGALRIYNSAAYLDPNEGFQGSYDKVGLVPWTEFTPWEGLASPKGSHFSHGSHYPLFSLRMAATERTCRFATPICYDVAFPWLFRRFMHDADGPPDFFLVCSSERSDRGGQMSRCALTMARARAIECRRSIVRNVHHGYSGIIDSTGLLHDEALPFMLDAATPLGVIPIDQRRTLCTAWGDWIPRAILGAVLVAAVWRLLRRPSLGRSNREQQLQKSIGC